MNLKIESLNIRNFRVFRELEITELGRVNLITGMNNTGKSSLLEALRILAYDAAPDVIYDILRHREENFERRGDELIATELEELFQVSALFHGFPSILGRSEPITLTARSELSPIELVMQLGLFLETRDEEGHVSMSDHPVEDFEDPDAVVAMLVQRGGRTRYYRQRNFERFYRYPTRAVRPQQPLGALGPCVYVSPYGGERTDALEQMWDAIALYDYQDQVVEALKIIEPRIEALAMVTDDSARTVRDSRRIAMVRASNIPRRVPLRSYGDGVNRLFAIILSLVNARGGILLIDEFENGLHWSAQTRAWQSVFELSKILDIQVFATTHSRDALESFVRVAHETQEIGSLIRMVRRGDVIVPVTYSEDELDIVVRGGIEVR